MVFHIGQCPCGIDPRSAYFCLGVCHGFPIHVRSGLGDREYRSQDPMMLRVWLKRARNPNQDNWSDFHVCRFRLVVAQIGLGIPYLFGFHIHHRV